MEQSLNPVKIINTHCHIDHILGNKFVSEQWNIELYSHKAELPLLENSSEIGKIYGLEDYEESPYPKKNLSDGDILTFGKSSFEILFTPGHSPGHICLYNKKNNLIIALGLDFFDLFAFHLYFLHFFLLFQDFHLDSYLKLNLK